MLTKHAIEEIFCTHVPIYFVSVREEQGTDSELSAVWAEKVETYNERKTTLEAQTASESKGE